MTTLTDNLFIVKDFIANQPGSPLAQRLETSIDPTAELSLILRSAAIKLAAPATNEGRDIAGVDVLAAIVEVYQGLTRSSNLRGVTGADWHTLAIHALPAAKQIVSFEQSCPVAIRFEDFHFPGSEHDGALDEVLGLAIALFENVNAQVR